MDCKSICETIEEKFPLEFAESYDNVGLLIGDENREVSKVLVALEVTEKVINEAIETKADLIVTHHPLIFKSIKKITSSGYIENLVLKLIENKIALYSAHTNFDNSNGGMNDILARKLGLINIKGLEEGLNYASGRIGELTKEMNFGEFCIYIKEKFELKNIIVSGDLERKINKVAVVGGSGSDYLKASIKKNCDCLITGDIKHHTALDYSNMGINIIDITHFESEIIFKEEMKTFLEKRLDTNILLSEVETNPLKII